MSPEKSGVVISLYNNTLLIAIVSDGSMQQTKPYQTTGEISGSLINYNWEFGKILTIWRMKNKALYDVFKTFVAILESLLIFLNLIHVDLILKE